MRATKEEKGRVFVKPSEWHKDAFAVFVGVTNLNQEVYVGPLRNALNIKHAFLATEEFVDVSENIYEG